MAGLNGSVWAGIIGIGWLAVLGPGSIEGYTAPAVTKLAIASEVADADGWVRFNGQTVRLREACNFAKIEWFLGKRDGKHVPTIVQTEKPKLRPSTGEIDLTGWRVYLGDTADNLSETYADVLHECRVGGIETPWLVRTAFWN